MPAAASKLKRADQEKGDDPTDRSRLPRRPGAPPQQQHDRDAQCGAASHKEQQSAGLLDTLGGDAGGPQVERRDQPHERIDAGRDHTARQHAGQPIEQVEGYKREAGQLLAKVQQRQDRQASQPTKHRAAPNR